MGSCVAQQERSRPEGQILVKQHSERGLYTRLDGKLEELSYTYPHHPTSTLGVDYIYMVWLLGENLLQDPDRGQLGPPMDPDPGSVPLFPTLLLPGSLQYLVCRCKTFTN